MDQDALVELTEAAGYRAFGVEDAIRRFGSASKSALPGRLDLTPVDKALSYVQLEISMPHGAQGPSQLDGIQIGTRQPFEVSLREFEQRWGPLRTLLWHAPKPGPDLAFTFHGAEVETQVILQPSRIYEKGDRSIPVNGLIVRRFPPSGGG